MKDNKGKLVSSLLLNKCGKSCEIQRFIIPQQIQTWRRYVVVPYGTDPINFACVSVAKAGLTLQAIFNQDGIFSPAPKHLSTDKILRWNVMNDLNQWIVVHLSISPLNLCSYQL